MTDWALTRGDDAAFDVALADVGDAMAATFTAKRAVRDLDAAALIRKDLEDGGVTVDVDGIHIDIAADDTRDLAAPMTLVWDLEVVDAGGLTTTVAGGILRIEADVTRDPGVVPGSGS